MAVIGKVPQENFGESLHRVVSADAPKASAWTNASTGAALDALISVDSSREFQVYDALRAGFGTAATVDTLSRGKTNLRPWVLRFRAVAEDTAKGTSFEEDHTADAGAILKTVSLDVNDEGEVTHVVHRAGAPGL